MSFADGTEKALQKVIIGVEEFKLSNGLKVLYYKRDEAPIFSAQIWVKVGGVDETTGQTGISHMFEHMAFKGSKTIGTKNYAREKGLLESLEKIMLESRRDEKVLVQKKDELEKLYSELSKLWVDNEFSVEYQKRGAVGLNAATGKDFTYYVVSLPSVAFELWAWMESDRILNPVFRQFYKELEVVKEERRSRTDDSPTGKLYETLLNTAYRAHPYRLPLIGWRSDLDNLTATEVREFYQTFYRPDNMVVVLVGDLELSKVKKTLEKYFANFKTPKGTIPRVKTTEPEQEGPREVVIEDDSEPGMVLAFHKEIYPSPDDGTFAVLHSVLGDGRSSILYKELVQEKQIASSIFTSEAPGDRYPSLFIVGGRPHKGVSNDKLKDEILKILNRLKRNKLPQSDIDAAIKGIKVSFLNSLNSSSGLANVLGNSETVYGGWQEVFKLYQGSFNTKPEDIQNLAKKYFKESKMTYAHRERK